MKALRYLFVLGSVGSLLFFSSCGGGGSTPEPVADQQFTKLSKTWTIASASNSVVLDGNDRTPEYLAGTTTGTSDPGPMTLTISGTKGNASTYTYTLAGRPQLSPWKKNGSWQFGTDPTKSITRDDGALITYVIDGTKLTVSFNFSGTGYTNPRTGVVTGNWTFIFTGN